MPKTAYSKVSVKSQTVVPAEVRRELSIGPGDRLRYVFRDDGVMLEKAVPEIDDPFATFSEWAGQVDDEDYADL